MALPEFVLCKQDLPWMVIGIVYQISFFLDGILATENYKNTYYLVRLQMKFPCR